MLVSTWASRLKTNLKATSSNVALPPASFRSIRSKPTPKSDTDYIGYVQGVVLPRTIPRESGGKLPKLFSSEADSEASKPASSIAKKQSLKKKKSIKSTKFKRATSDEPKRSESFLEKEEFDLIAEFKSAMREELGRAAGRIPNGSYEEAVLRTNQTIQKAEREWKLRQMNNEPLVNQNFEVEEEKPFIDEDELIDDELVSQWKADLVKRTKKALPGESKSTIKKKLTSKTKTSSKKTTKVSSKKTTKASSKTTTKASGKTKKVKTPSSLEGGQEESASYKQNPQILEPTNTSINDQQSTSPNHQDGFSDSIGNSASSVDTNHSSSREGKTSLPLNRRLKKSSPKKSVTFDDTDEAVLLSMQAQDDIAMQKYIDNYDQDLISRPPIAAATFRGTFTDVKSTSPAVIQTTGTTLSLKTRGIRFDGTDTLYWKVRDHLVAQDVATLKFDFHLPPFVPTDIPVQGNRGVIPLLNNVHLDFAIPVKIASKNEKGQEDIQEGAIHVFAIHREHWNSLSIYLKMPDGTVIKPSLLGIDEYGRPTTFDDQIKQIQHQLPAKVYLKTCWNCAFSEYSPISKQPFGAMACFRQWPGVANLRDKMDLLRNWYKHLELVQETHLCDSFKRRTKPRIEGFRNEPPQNKAGIKQREYELEKAQNESL